MLKIQNNKNIQRKISSLTLMAIMVAGGMTFAVPGMVPEAYAANANLFVSAENSLFDNYMSGPQVIEVVVRDSSISDTDELKGEPNVTVNDKQLRMVQATDGNWYGYFADYTMADLADNEANMQFGTGPSKDISKILKGPNEKVPADAFFYNSMTEKVNVVREYKGISDASTKIGQIGLQDNAWPFIQLYELSQGGNVVIQYNKGGGAQSTTLTFDTVDDFAGIELDRTSYPQGADVHATITDPWLNIDPTDEDSWTFATAGDNEAIFYQVFDESGERTSEDDPSVLSNAGDLMCEDGCVLKLDTAVQGDSIITLQDNNDSDLKLDNPQDITTAFVPDRNRGHIAGLQAGTQPITITEQGTNSGIFTTYDENDKSVILITDKAARGTSATIDYNDSPQSVLVTHAFATIDIQPASDVWNSGELIPVVLVDADVNKNSRSDEAIDLGDPKSTIIPSLRTGSPITLGSGELTVDARSADGNSAPRTNVTVDAFSDRAILEIKNGEEVKSLSIDLGITGKQLKSSLIDTNDGNYGYNLFNYDIRSLDEGKDNSPGKVNISLVNTDNGTEIKVPLVCNTSETQGLGLLSTDACDSYAVDTPTTPVDTTPEPIVIPLLYSGSAYESQHFGTAFDEAVSDFNATQTSKAFSSQKLNLGTTAIQSVLDTGAQGAVGTYTSEQLRELNDTGKIGTDTGDIVLLSYSSAAQSFAEPDDGIFRLTTDTSRQVSSVVTQLIPTGTFDNVISIHLNDAWSNDYVAALEATYGDDHRTIAYDTAYDTTTANMTAQFRSVLTDGTTGLSGLDSRTAIVILEFDHDRLDALITELARTGAYAGISTTKFIIPDVPSGAFGTSIHADALALLKATDMQTIKFALSGNTTGQTALTTAIRDQIPRTEVSFDGNELFDRHAYSAYDAGQILTRAINALDTGYTSAQLNAEIPKAAAAYSSDALIYNTMLNADGDLACMVYDIFEIDDSTGGFTLQTPMQATTDATNCPATNPIVVPTVPGAPISLTANHRDAAVELTWTAPTSGDAPTSYKVQQSTDAGTTWADSTTATVTGTTAMVTGLSNGQAYSFRVFATNSVGDSLASNTATATPSATLTKPGAPTGLTATAGDGQVELSWTAGDDGGSAITAYTVEQSIDAANTFTSSTVTINGTEATVTGLTNGQNYIFRVSATNTQGTGPVSNNVPATPTAPVNDDPVITTTTGSGQAGTALSQQIVATDPENNNLEYDLLSAGTASGLTISTSGLIEWSSPVEGSHSVSFSVTDGTNTVQGTITITIAAATTNGGSTPQNNAPVIETIGDKTVKRRRIIDLHS